MESKYSQSAFETKIGSNRFLRIIWELATVPEQQRLQEHADGVVTAMGLQPIGNQFPPQVQGADGKAKHLTREMPVFVANFMTIDEVKGIVTRIMTEVNQLTDNKEQLDLIGRATLSAAKKWRSPQTSDKLDKLQYVSIDDRGDFQEVDERHLRDLNSLINYSHLATISRQPLAMALVAKKGRYNDRTKWTNPAAIAEIRAGAGKIARLNEEASYLKSKLIEKAKRVFTDCTNNNSCTKNSLNDAFNLDDAEDLLYKFKKQKRLASMNSRMANIDLVLQQERSDEAKNSLLELKRNLEASRNALIAAQRRPAGRRRSSRRSSRRSARGVRAPPQAGAGQVEAEPA